jgi:hypothetical protein
MFIPSNDTVIGNYKKTNGELIPIEFKYIYDLTRVYVPEKKNNFVVNMINICPEYMCSMVYKWFIENVIDDKNNNLKKKEIFGYWMCIYLKKHYPKINESNWRVYILKLN